MFKSSPRLKSLNAVLWPQCQGFFWGHFKAFSLNFCLSWQHFFTVLLQHQVVHHQPDALPILIKGLTKRLIFSKAASRFTSALTSVVKECGVAIVEQPTLLNEIPEQVLLQLELHCVRECGYHPEIPRVHSLPIACRRIPVPSVIRTCAVRNNGLTPNNLSCHLHLLVWSKLVFFFIWFDVFFLSSIFVWNLFGILL